jgi:hypothetical protein
MQTVKNQLSFSVVEFKREQTSQWEWGVAINVNDVLIIDSTGTPVIRIIRDSIDKSYMGNVTFYEFENAK